MSEIVMDSPKVFGSIEDGKLVLRWKRLKDEYYYEISSLYSDYSYNYVTHNTKVVIDVPSGSNEMFGVRVRSVLNGQYSDYSLGIYVYIPEMRVINGGKIDVVKSVFYGNASDVSGSTLFDGITTSNSNINMAYFYNTSNYIEFRVDSDVAIWRCGSYVTANKGTFTVYRVEEDGKTLTKLNYIHQECTVKGNGQWEKTIFNLPKGQYRFTYGSGRRCDNEWVIESLGSNDVVGKVDNLKVDFSNDSTYGITWDNIDGCDSCDVYINDVLKESVTTNRYDISISEKTQSFYFSIVSKGSNGTTNFSGDYFVSGNSKYFFKIVNEMPVYIKGSTSGGAYVSIAYDKVLDDLASTTKSIRFDSTSRYIELDIKEDCNIWRAGSSWPVECGTFDIYEIRDYGYLNLVTDKYVQVANPIGVGYSEMSICNLPRGKYRFAYGSGIRRDVEWIFESIQSKDVSIGKVKNINYSIVDNDITLTWDMVEGIDSYDIYNFDLLLKNVVGNSTTITLSNNTIMSFEIRPVVGVGKVLSVEEPDYVSIDTSTKKRIYMGNYRIINQNMSTNCMEGLFDRFYTYNTSKVWNFASWSTGRWGEVEFTTDVRIWRAGGSTSSFGALKISKIMDDGSYEVVSVKQELFNNYKYDIRPYIQSLPKGKYRFDYLTSARIDVGWFLEVSPCSSPKNVTLENDNGIVTLTWDGDSNSDRYIISDSSDGRVLGDVNTTSFTFEEEFRGNVNIKACNKGYTSNPTNDIYVCSRPENPVGIDIRSVSPDVDGSGNVFEVSFLNDSHYVDGFNIHYYSNGEYRGVVKLKGNYSFGEKIISEVIVPKVRDGVMFDIRSYNEGGESSGIVNSYDVTRGVLWTYRRESGFINISIENNLKYDMEMSCGYNIVYERAGYYLSVYVDGGTLDRVSHTINVGDTILFIDGVIDGKLSSVFGNKIIANQVSDLGLVAPSNFKYRWVDEGRVEFSWVDDYIFDCKYEFVYSINNGDEVVEVINTKDDLGYGGIQSLDITLNSVGDTIVGKVRMVWELNETDYTNILSTFFFKVDDPIVPTISQRYRSFSGMFLGWDMQSYIDRYEIVLTSNLGEHIYETSDNSYDLPIDYEFITSVDVKIRACYIGGDRSNFTNSIVFSTSYSGNVDNIYLCNNGDIDGGTHTTIYTHDEYSNDDDLYVCDLGVKQFDDYFNTITFFKEWYDGVILTRNCDSVLNNYSINYVIRNTTKEIYDVHQAVVSYGVFDEFDYLTLCCDVKTKYDKGYFQTTYYTKGDRFGGLVSMGVPNFNLVQDVKGLETKYTNPSVWSFGGELDTCLFTTTRYEQFIHSEITKVVIVTLGDSITAGHPGFWAESGTGDMTSQYQYWFQRRIGDEYHVINKGYGRDTTSILLKRFEKDLLQYNAKYCVIQIGTNDLYEAMTEGNGNQEVLNTKLALMRTNTISMINICLQNKIVPVLGTLIPRTGAKGIYRLGLWSHNEWIKSYCNQNNGIYYVDFYNAGKQSIPPTPFEDPDEPGAMNPCYDGDNVYDDYGNIVVRGTGIHPNVLGYKLMGESIPLYIFKSSNTGIKMYLDSKCENEEEFELINKIDKIYHVDVKNVNRGRNKVVTRYIKNVGGYPVMFSIYQFKVNGVSVQFKPEGSDNIYKYGNGYLLPTRSMKMEIYIDVPEVGDEPYIELDIVSRSLRQLS